jgi:hypothetical protein
MEILNMKNFKPLNFVGSESYCDCTHTMGNSEVVFSIELSDGGFYEVTVKVGTLGMSLQFMSMSKAQIWANYIYCQMELDGVRAPFETNEYAVKFYKREVA